MSNFLFASLHLSPIDLPINVYLHKPATIAYFSIAMKWIAGQHLRCVDRESIGVFCDSPHSQKKKKEKNWLQSDLSADHWYYFDATELVNLKLNLITNVIREDAISEFTIIMWCY